MAKVNYNGTLAERFDRYSIPEPNSGCLLWTGTDNGWGYGTIYRDGRNVLATHVALYLAGRPVPKGLCALHKCDVPACVNVDHLFIGSHADNIADKIAKERHARQYVKKTHCKQGHEFTKENLLITKAGRRIGKRLCKICAGLRQRRRHHG